MNTDRNMQCKDCQRVMNQMLLEFVILVLLVFVTGALVAVMAIAVWLHWMAAIAMGPFLFGMLFLIAGWRFRVCAHRSRQALAAFEVADKI